MTAFKHLRVEESKPATPVAATVGRVVPIQVPQQAPTIVEPSKDLEHWRGLAVKNGERLALAEAQAKDLREAADEARGRFSKYKTRLDSANARVNELQIELTRVSAERDALRERIARQDFIKREIHAFRQSILDGPIWNVFSELCSDVSATAGEEKKQS